MAKSKSSNLFRNALIGVGLYYLFYRGGTALGYQIADNIDYQFGGVKVRWNWQDVQHVYLDMPLTVTNNNTVGASAQRFSAGLFYSNAKLGDILINQPFSLPPGQPVSLTLTARIRVADVPFEIMNLINAGELLGSVRIQGTLYTNRVAIPIDTTVPII